MLDGLSLTIDRGQSVCVVGESGCGKTTLLRCISLLEYIDDGVIRYDGQKIIEGTAVNAKERPRWLCGGRATYCVHVSEPAYRRRCGVVFQSYNLFPNKTVIDNVTEGPVYVLGHRRVEAVTRARELLDQVGIAGRERAYPNELSGGEQQRVAIARALAMQPEILLFDEITSALDPPRVAAILEIIKRLRDGESRTAMVLVTHHIEFAKDVADKVCFLDRGRIAVEGAPGDVLVDPNNERLAAFLESVRAIQ